MFLYKTIFLNLNVKGRDNSDLSYSTCQSETSFIQYNFFTELAYSLEISDRRAKPLWSIENGLSENLHICKSYTNVRPEI